VLVVAYPVVYFQQDVEMQVYYFSYRLVVPVLVVEAYRVELDSPFAVEPHYEFVVANALVLLHYTFP